jgi:hypothetical protein
MRGGSLVMVVWALLNLILLIGDWIWQGTQIGVAMTGYTVLLIDGLALIWWASNRESLRRGPPDHDPTPQPVPRASLGSALIGFSIVVILYGVVFGKFLVFMGAGLLVVSLGRVARELIWQQRTLRAFRREHGRS